MTDELRPLTQRILSRLPGSRALWIALWALVPWLNATANLLLETDTSAVWEQRRLLVILNYAALSLAMVITLWGTSRIADRLETLRTPAAAVDARKWFNAVNSVRAPLVLAVLTAVAFGLTALERDGWTAAFLRGATWLILGIAIWTFLWVYGALQLGLDRLGHAHLPSGPPVDPSLGLRPLGDVAFMGLWMLLIWLMPVLLTGLPDVIGVVVGLVVLAGGLGVFFLSLIRLHRQMVDRKAAELATARSLYAQAVEPVRAEPTLEVLERQQSRLSAADALEKRAHAIHEWPIDEGTFARVLTITTSVIAMMIARLILDPLGL